MKQICSADGAFDLVVSVYKRAVRDARRGDPEAIEFLTVTAPDVAERLGLATKRGNRGGVAQRNGMGETAEPAVLLSQAPPG